MTSFSVVHLDGTMDWMVAQRDALLAWTGYTLNVRPAINTKMVSMDSYYNSLMLTVEELGALG